MTSSPVQRLTLGRFACSCPPAILATSSSLRNATPPKLTFALNRSPLALYPALALHLATSRHSTFAINTFSIHFTSFAFLPLLCAAQSKGQFAEPGNILNIASLSGITAHSQKGQFNYNSSK
jgi:hypothetical protein